MIGIENTQRVGVFFRVARKIVMAGLVLPFSALTRAEVTLDGTLGPADSLAGPNFVIPDTVGQTVGTNLFHSFGLFNINTGESATFTGPSSIENVLGRVTGGSPSFIDGLLRTQFENASPNLFLLNPAGVLWILFPITTGIFAKGDLGVPAPECVFAEERRAGNITVTAGNLEVRNGAVINTSSSFTEQAGNVTVTADHVFLSGDGATFTGIFTDGFGSEFGAGRAGNITVTAGNLEVRNGAEINASFRGLGQGGNVAINATDITLQDGGRISAESSSLGTQADAGDITLEVGNLLHLSNDSRITTSAAGGTGKGGNITLNSVFVVLDEGSRIIANALEGQAGNIFIRILGGGALFKSPDSLIKASNKFGIDGSVVIDAPDTDIIAGLAGLPANFLDAATALTQLCAERSGANVSSLVFRKYEVLPDSPYALRVQLPRAIPAPRTAKQSRAPRTYYAGSPLRPMLSCLWNG